MEFIETKTSMDDFILKTLDSTTEKIHILRDKKADTLKELKAIDTELQILETNRTTMQKELLALDPELADIPSKHEDAISRQQFLASHSKSYNRFWDDFRLNTQGLGRLL